MSVAVKKTKVDSYQNYKLSKGSNNEIDIVELDDPKTTKEWFFENYIKPRKPALIKYAKGSEKFRLDVDKFKLDQIGDTLKSDTEQCARTWNGKTDAELLQVEELNNGGFGSGQKRLKMAMDEFLKRVKLGESLYLTTQYVENDPEEGSEEDSEELSCGEKQCHGDDAEEGDDDDGGSTGVPFGAFDSDASDFEDMGDMHDDFDEMEELADDSDDGLENDCGSGQITNDIYQPPLNGLLDGKLGNLPPHAVEITEPLVPQQINLWLGRTPSETPQMEVEYSEDGEVRSVNRGLPVKNATSTGLHHDHADNLYVLVQGKKRFTLYSPDCAPSLYTTGDIRHIYHTGVIDYVANDKARNWTNVRADGACIDMEGAKKESRSSTDDTDGKQDPPSFCRIPPALLHLDEIDDRTRKVLEKLIKKDYPNFSSIQDTSLKVTLEDGDLLYLPAGWFHEVTSYGDECKDNTHIALNYWFVPPDNGDVHQPYTDSVWQDDYEAWKRKFLH